MREDKKMVLNHEILGREVNSAPELCSDHGQVSRKGQDNKALTTGTLLNVTTICFVIYFPGGREGGGDYHPHINVIGVVVGKFERNP